MMFPMTGAVKNKFAAQYANDPSNPLYGTDRANEGWDVMYSGGSGPFGALGRNVRIGEAQKYQQQYTPSSPTPTMQGPSTQITNSNFSNFGRSQLMEQLWNIVQQLMKGY